MSKNKNLIPTIPDGFIELSKSETTNQASSNLLINISEIALVESTESNTEITLKNGKVVTTADSVEDVKESILDAQFQLTGVKNIYKHPPTTKTKLLMWLAYQPNVSSKLARAIREMEVVTGIEYVEEVTKDQFLRVKNIGKQTWHEFTRLQGS